MTLMSVWYKIPTHSTEVRVIWMVCLMRGGERERCFRRLFNWVCVTIMILMAYVPHVLIWGGPRILHTHI